MKAKAKIKGKTHRGAAKRFKTTGTGKFKRNKAGKRHLLTHKSAKWKRSMSGSTIVSKSQTAIIKHLLPHS